MIKSLVVKGLWGRYDYDLQFNEDVNIFTGSNGTGKTTLLKMLWYAYSGNYEQMLKEAYFEEVFIEIDDDTFIFERTKKQTVVRDSKDKALRRFAGDYIQAYKGKEKKPENSLFLARMINNSPFGIDFEDDDATQKNNSYFFPTFRRIEGGFSIQESTELVNALNELRTRLSKHHHRFIASSNSEDIRGMVNEISSDIRVKLEAINAVFMAFIAENVNAAMNDGFTEKLKKEIALKDYEEADVKEPIDNLSNYVDQFFLEKSIKISENLKLGHHKNEISIEYLSAGEKNFLSFLVYATSLEEGVIFIDEPELNLHIDWQRALVSTLRDIAPNVQLFMASHSPGIYTNYTDKAPWFNDLMKPYTSPVRSNERTGIPRPRGRGRR